MKLILSLFALYLVYSHQHIEEVEVDKGQKFLKYKMDHSRIYRREVSK